MDNEIVMQLFYGTQERFEQDPELAPAKMQMCPDRRSFKITLGDAEWTVQVKRTQA